MIAILWMLIKPTAECQGWTNGDSRISDKVEMLIMSGHPTHQVMHASTTSISTIDRYTPWPTGNKNKGAPYP